MNSVLPDRRWVTDGGLEPDLVLHHDVDLPEFASFPRVEHDAGRKLLVRYYDGYADVARKGGAGLLLEAPTSRRSTSAPSLRNWAGAH